jgi:ribosomal 30S subunit maturation factor RimM
MPEIREREIKDKNAEIQKADSTEEFSRRKEKQKGSYYYDDGCGYEVYQPDDDKEDDSE